MNDFTLKNLRKALKKIERSESEGILDDYKKVILREEIDEKATHRLLNLIAVLVVSGDAHLIKMAYYMAIHVGICANDYAVLRDISTRLGYYPVINLVDRIEKRNTQDFDDMSSLLPKVFASIYKGEYYRTEEQYYFTEKVKTLDNVRAIAPTSYGKSQLMIQKCIDKFQSGNRVCIITPTKSLLMQTVSEITKNKGDRHNVITHPDMMTNGIATKPHIAVLTQERLLSIVSSFPDISYKYIFVDEAHNILDKDPRAVVLARAIIILKTRDPSASVDYYSPFIQSPDEALDIVGVSNDYEISRIDEFIKVPQFYIWREDNAKMQVYDQFIDLCFDYKTTSRSIFSTTIDFSGNKNVIYANKPSDIEYIADKLAACTEEIIYCEKSKAIIEEACKSLSALVHGSYNLIHLLKHGIVISHGRMTDVVKNYVEYLFKNIPELKYIVTTSTLLEGVNIPAERIFIYDYSKGKGNLSTSSFHNLVGRICRFRDVFSEHNTSAELLIPKIYLMSSKEFSRKNSDIEKFVRNVAKDDSSPKEPILNPLLEEYNAKDKVERRIKETTVLGNIDTKHCSEYERISQTQPVSAQTSFGRLCFKNGIEFFDIFSFENAIEEQLKRVDMIDNADTLLKVVIRHVLEPTYSPSNNSWIYTLFTSIYTYNKILAVLKNRTSGDFNFSKLIALDIGNWMKHVKESGSHVAYVGKIGDCDKNKRKGSFNNYHVFDSSNTNLMASYAVSLEKENLDNIDYNLMPIIEVLNGLGKIESIFYKRLKYGTDDDFSIGLIRLGADLALANTITAKEGFKELFTSNNENLICVDKIRLLERMNKAKVPSILIKSADDIF